MQRGDRALQVGHGTALRGHGPSLAVENYSIAMSPPVTPELTTIASTTHQLYGAACIVAGLCASLTVQVDWPPLVHLHPLIEAASYPVQPLDDLRMLRREVSSLSRVGVEVVEFRFVEHPVMALE